MREIRLHGHLGKKFGRSFMLDVKSPAEALRALKANLPGFESYMFSHASSGFRVYVGNKAVDAAGLVMESSKKVIRFTPVVAGSGRGVGQVLVGALIIAAALSSGGAALAAMGATGALTAGAITGMAVSFGVSLVIGGVTQMLMSPPGASNKDAPDNKPSYAFNGPVNTTAQGNVVPICYGQMLIGSQVVSAGLSVEDNYALPGTTTSSTGGIKRAVVATPWDE